AEDYDLWARLLQRTRGANLQQPLVLRRVHPHSVTATRLREQEHISTAIAARQIANLAPWLDLTPEEVGRLRQWTGAFPAALSAEDLPLCRKFLSILSAFESLNGLDPAIVERIRDCWHGRVRSAVASTAWARLNGAPAQPVAVACHSEEVQYG